MEFDVKQSSGFCEVGDFCGRAAHVAGRTSVGCEGGRWVAGMWWCAGSSGMPRGPQEHWWCPGTEWCLETAMKHWSTFQKWSITLPEKTHTKCRGFHNIILKKKKKKITWKQHADKSIRIAKSQNTDHTQCWQESGAHSFRNSHSLLVSMQNGAATLEDSQSLHNWTYSCRAVQQSCFLMFAQRNWELISTWKPEHGCL